MGVILKKNGNTYESYIHSRFFSEVIFKSLTQEVGLKHKVSGSLGKRNRGQSLYMLRRLGLEGRYQVRKN